MDIQIEISRDNCTQLKTVAVLVILPKLPLTFLKLMIVQTVMSVYEI